MSITSIMIEQQQLLVGVAIGAVGVLLVAFFSYPFCQILFAKRYPVPPKDGAIVITGASTGIGNHAALHLAKSGFVVYAGVRKQSDAEALIKLGISTLKPVILDVAKSVSCGMCMLLICQA